MREPVKKRTLLALTSLTGLFLSLMFLNTSCGKKKKNIAGEFEGIWKTEWEDKLKGDMEDINVNEVIEFINDDASGNSGTFRQLFEGEVKYEDWSNESWMPYSVLISGTWIVKDKNKISLKYDMEDMVLNLGKSDLKGDYTDAGISLLFGDWSGAIASAMKAGNMEKKNKRIETEAKKQLTAFFKDMFHTINKDRKAMTDVTVEGSMMTCEVNHGFFGRKQVYDKVRVDKISGRKGRSNIYDAPGDLDNFDWLCERYATDSDLNWRTKAQLRIMRNWIFARHGYIFKSEDLQEYFAQFPWYYPVSTNVASELSKLENANIKKIKEYE